MAGAGERADALRECERLWNAVKAAEKRKAAQAGPRVRVRLSHELDQARGVELAQNFVERKFVSRGMIADLNVHWDIREDGEPKPYAHVMLTTRRWMRMV